MNEYSGLGCVMPFSCTFSVIDSKSDIYYKEAGGNKETRLARVRWNP
ncbi:MAG: hypothetical protein M3M84_06240 [Thermoproteota archaeon]|nr:hypothetical protein [Thermoproteota archaeon]